MTRKGHFDRCLRLFGYLQHNPKGRLKFDSSDPNLTGVIFEKHDWTDVYPDAAESLPPGAPKPLGARELKKITIFVDASHASCLTTRRTVTGILVITGKTPVKWYSKRQNTVGSSSYGSELVALRIAVEAALDIRYKLRMMGLRVENASTMLCDNQATVFNTQFPSTNLKKKHNAVAYHQCREAVAADFIRVGHIPGVNNISDILTKPKGPQVYYQFLSNLLFGRNGS